MSEHDTGSLVSSREAGRAWRRPLAKLGVDIRSGEGRVVSILSLYFLLLFTCFYATKAVRQSTFVDSLGAESLPYVYLLVALCAYPALRFYGLIAGRLRQHVLIATWSLVVAATMAGFFFLYRLPGTWVPVLFYVWVTLAFGIAVSQFWTYTSHNLDPRQARRLFAFIAAGGALGGIAGGQVARLAGAWDTRFALLAVAAMLVLAAAVIHLVPRFYQVEEERVAGAGMDEIREAAGGFDAIRRSTYLKLIAALVVLTVLVAQCVDLQFNWAVQRSTEGLSERTAAFGGFYSLVGLGAFFFQLLFTARIQRHLGLSFAMRVLPVTVAVGTGALMITAALGPAAFVVVAWSLKITEGGLRHSLDQVTRELLFLPVPSASRLKAKAAIDVFVQRFAKGIGALILLPVTFGVLSAANAGWVSLGLIAVWVGLTAGAHRLYARAFRDSLSSGSLDPEAVIDFSDATTVETLVQSLGSADSRQVLHSLDLLSSHERARLVPPVFLHHEDPAVRRKTLELLADVGRHDAVPLIARTLGDSDADVRAQAVQSLAALVGESAWEVMLPRLRSPDSRERAAAIACLAQHRDDAMAGEAGAVLSEMLSDADPSVRQEAARALGQIPEPTGQEELVELLYDSDSNVMREAIVAVRHRVSSAGRSNPLYVPILISLMRDRRLKHDCRQALVACGEAVIPALAHFMKDPNEQIWVRRASPKTIANIGGPAAARALADSLRSSDAFLRRKVIEALMTLRGQGMGMDFASPTIELQMREEARQYLEHLAALVAIDSQGQGQLDGPLVSWRNDHETRPGLLEDLLAERIRNRVKNLLGLLALVYSPDDIRAAELGLFSGRPAARSHALEYLDYTLAGDIHRHIFIAIEDVGVQEKLRRAERMFDIPLRSLTGTLHHLITARDEDPDRPTLVAAALYTAYERRMTGLYTLIRSTRDQAHDPLVEETARWLVERMDEEGFTGAAVKATGSVS